MDYNPFQVIFFYIDDDDLYQVLHVYNNGRGPAKLCYMKAVLLLMVHAAFGPFY